MSFSFEPIFIIVDPRVATASTESSFKLRVIISLAMNILISLLLFSPATIEARKKTVRKKNFETSFRKNNIKKELIPNTH